MVYSQLLSIKYNYILNSHYKEKCIQDLHGYTVHQIICNPLISNWCTQR